MSVQALSWVLDNSQAKHSARLVLISIANHTDKYGDNAWPSVRTIAEESKLSDRVVQGAIQQLVKLGELEVVSGGGPNKRYLFRLPLMGGNIITPQNLHPAETIAADPADSGIDPADSGDAIRKNRPLEQPSKTTGVDYMFIWNENCGEMAKLRSMTKQREKKLRSRAKALNFLFDFMAAVKKAAATPFLSGQNDRGWRADFDWMINNDTNYVKVLEGKYDRNGKSNGANRKPSLGQLRDARENISRYEEGADLVIRDET